MNSFESLQFLCNTFDYKQLRARNGGSIEAMTTLLENLNEFFIQFNQINCPTPHDITRYADLMADIIKKSEAAEFDYFFHAYNREDNESLGEHLARTACCSEIHNLKGFIDRMPYWYQFTGPEYQPLFRAGMSGLYKWHDLVYPGLLPPNRYFAKPLRLLETHLRPPSLVERLRNAVGEPPAKRLFTLFTAGSSLQPMTPTETDTDPKPTTSP